MFATSLSVSAMSLEDSIKMYEGKRNVYAIEELVSKDINSTDNEGRTALILASLEGYTEIVEALINKEANLNATFSWDNWGNIFEGTTALMVASSEGNTEIAKMLIEAGADLDATFSINSSHGTSGKGGTALIMAIGRGNAEIAKMLIKANANLEATFSANDSEYDFEGLTALIIAILDNDTEIVQMLIDKGANLDIVFSIKYEEMTFKGTALEYVLEFNNAEVYNAPSENYAEMIKILKKAETK